MNHKTVMESRNRIDRIKKDQLNYPMTAKERRDLEDDLSNMDSSLYAESERNRKELNAILEILAVRIIAEYSREKLIDMIWGKE